MSTIKPLCIANGPSKDRLFDSMKYQYEARPIEANFKVSESKDDDKNIFEIRNLKIHTLKFRNSTGLEFILEGVCDADLTRGSITVYAPYKFTAVYDASRRKGDIEFKKGYW